MSRRVALEFAGAPGDPAVTAAGRTWTYREFAGLVDAAPTSRLVDLSGMTLPFALAAAFAAARAGTSVLARDPQLPVPRIGAIPPGTWLVATTSGTSGRPRAVCRTARSWALSIRPLADITGIGPRDRVAPTGPLHATLHLFAAVHTLCVGAHLVGDVHDATAVHCVPAVLADLVSSGAGTARLRTAVVAGSNLPDAVAKRAAAQGISVIEYYGAAELSFVAIRRWPEPALRPFPGAELRVGAGGRLWVRSPYRALGYAPAAPTSPTIDGDGCDAGRPIADDAPARRGVGSYGSLQIDADGFATVGDLARATDAGPGGGTAAGVVILGRGDAAITVGGATVLAEDVETALTAIPGVVAAAVVGLPHPRLGEIAAAALELDGTATPAEVRAAARAVLSGPSLPRKYVIVDRLPRTAAGKIARNAARRLFKPAPGFADPTILRESAPAPRKADSRKAVESPSWRPHGQALPHTARA